jgi:hypothetical protein
MIDHDPRGRSQPDAGRGARASVHDERDQGNTFIRCMEARAETATISLGMWRFLNCLKR